MKHLSITVAALSLLVAPVVVRAADQPSANQPSGASNPAMNAAPTDNANPSAAAPSPGGHSTGSGEWTSLKGTVQAVDKRLKPCRSKTKPGKLVQVPVDRQVSIQKEDGKNVSCLKSRPADVIILAKKNGSSTRVQDVLKLYPPIPPCATEPLASARGRGGYSRLSRAPRPS